MIHWRGEIIMQDGLISEAQTLKLNWIHTSNQCRGLSKQVVGHYVQSEGGQVKNNVHKGCSRS